MPTDIAQNIANEYLEKINLSNIAYKRPIKCTNIEVLSSMLLRAIMCKNKTIILSNPIHLLNNLKDIKDIIRDIKAVIGDKNIMLLDILSNEIHYEGCPCHIIK
jgi:hypothetical protein